MTKNLPDYSTIEVPDETPATEYTTHERRAEVLQLVIQAGSPFMVNQSQLARRYDVHRSTISRDMARLRESIAAHLGDDAKFATRALFEKLVRDLQSADDWRAKKAAWDIMMDWNTWLAKLGEQYREPKRSEFGVDVRSRHSEVSYQIVREGDDGPLPTTETGDGEEHVDYDALGFTSAPVTVEIEEKGDGDG